MDGPDTAEVGLEDGSSRATSYKDRPSKERSKRGKVEQLRKVKGGLVVRFVACSTGRS
jgi:hypothetical protein